MTNSDEPQHFILHPCDLSFFCKKKKVLTISFCNHGNFQREKNGRAPSWGKQLHCISLRRVIFPLTSSSPNGYTSEGQQPFPPLNHGLMWPWFVFLITNSICEMLEIYGPRFWCNHSDLIILVLFLNTEVCYAYINSGFLLGFLFNNSKETHSCRSERVFDQTLDLWLWKWYWFIG